MRNHPLQDELHNILNALAVELCMPKSRSKASSRRQVRTLKELVLGRGKIPQDIELDSLWPQSCDNTVDASWSLRDRIIFYMGCTYRKSWWHDSLQQWYL